MKVIICCLTLVAWQTYANELEGRIHRLEVDGLMIHSYVAPESAQLTTAHIIESENALVLVDGQFIRAYAAELGDYLECLGKPLDRILLSHPRSLLNHYIQDAPTYALPQIADGLDDADVFYIDNRRQALGGQIVGRETKIDRLMDTNETTIDNVRYQFRLAPRGQASPQALIKLPDHNLVIVQNMMSANAHVFFGDEGLSDWINTLQAMRDANQSSYILVGRGFPPVTDAENFDRQIAYLSFAQALQEKYRHGATQDMISAMREAYPHYGAVGLVNISSLFFHAKSAANSPQGNKTHRLGTKSD